MRNIYEAVTKAISAHWKAHDTKYPQKLVMSPEQRGTFMRLTWKTGEDSRVFSSDEARLSTTPTTR